MDLKARMLGVSAALSANHPILMFLTTRVEATKTTITPDGPMVTTSEQYFRSSAERFFETSERLDGLHKMINQIESEIDLNSFNGSGYSIERTLQIAMEVAR